MNTKEKVNELRASMLKEGMDFYIVPSGDPHQSEYVCDHFKGREYMSGFTGSAGTLLVSKSQAGLWTDGRYFIMAEKELQGSDIQLFKMDVEGYPSLKSWIYNQGSPGQVIGVDGRLISTKTYKHYMSFFNKKDMVLSLDHDLVGRIWPDRPRLPENPIFDHDLSFCGMSRQDKIDQVRNKMKGLLNDKGVEGYLISSLDDLAWLFNIRGSDILDTPVALSYGLITDSTVELYINLKKIPDDLKENLIKEGLVINSYEGIEKRLSAYNGSSICFDPSRVNALLYTSLPESVEKVEIRDITTELKAIKNDIEIKNYENAQVRDGVAMVKFIHWLKNKPLEDGMTEYRAAEQLEDFRSQGDNYRGKSFESIAAYLENAAMMHYHPKKDGSKVLDKKGFFLMDSGGQYLDGTTDITRTFQMGPLTEEEKTDYTLVLKGHINLCKAKFLKGTLGLQLDILARQPLWEAGIDYKCGTGHGLGYFLGVHEGPQSISTRLIDVVIEEGMITTIEPGVYKEGSHGIRIENTVLTVKDQKTPSGQFLKFQTLSYCPIDLEPVMVELLSESERQWLNDYHQMVYEKLSPYLDQDLKDYLKVVCKAI